MEQRLTFVELKESEREARKQLIIDAAINLFARKSFSSISIRDIAAEAGISPALIYRYFANQDELFLEAFVHRADVICKNVEKRIKENKGISIERIAIDYIDYLLKHDSFFQMMTHFMINSELSDEVLEKFNATQRYLLNIFDEVFRNLGAENNVRILSHGFFSSLNGILITFRNYPGRSQEEIRKHMHRLAGLVARSFSYEAQTQQSP